MDFLLETSTENMVTMAMIIKPFILCSPFKSSVYTMIMITNKTYTNINTNVSHNIVSPVLLCRRCMRDYLEERLLERLK
jgi:hypothetical protein